MPSKKDKYIIDVHKLVGNAMEFLDFCSNFISRIIFTS